MEQALLRHDEGGRKLGFDISKLERIGKIYDMTIEIEVTSKCKDRTYRTHRTLLGLDKHSSDLSQYQSITDNESLIIISNNNTSQNDKEVTTALKSSTGGYSNNASEPSEPSELKRVEYSFKCYHCEDFQTNNEDHYLRHYVISHSNKPCYPSKIDLERHRLLPQGKSWEIGTTTQLQEESPCPICNKPGQRKVAELLPNCGELWSVVNEDGTAHEWSRFDSVESSREDVEEQIICPICGSDGKIITYRNDKIHYPYKYDFKISHGVKNCEIIGQEDRDVVLKKLGRYVGEEQQQPQQRKQPKQSKRPRITCTVCFKPGAIRYINPRTSMTVYEHRDEPPISEYVYHKTGKKYFRYRRCYGGRALHSLEEIVKYGVGCRRRRKMQLSSMRQLKDHHVT